MRLKGETALQEGLWEPEPPAGAGWGGGVLSAVSRAERAEARRRPGGQRRSWSGRGGDEGPSLRGARSSGGWPRTEEPWGRDLQRDTACLKKTRLRKINMAKGQGHYHSKSSHQVGHGCIPDT